MRLLPIKRMRPLGALAVLVGVLVVQSAQAESFPSRPIHLVIGFTPAGTTDMLARLIAAQMSKTLGQSVVVENRAGASGTIAADLVARSPKDGYTIMFTTSSVHGIAPSLFKKLPYDSVKDFAPVGLVSKSTMVLMANNDLPVRTVADVIALAKKRPDALAYASSGPGSTFHLVASMFAKRADVAMLHVPYKGGGSSMPALMAGDVQLAFDNIASTRPLITAGRVRAIAVTSAQRAPSLPDVPTLAESGMPGFSVFSWGGVVAPAGTPATVIAVLNSSLNKALLNVEVTKAMRDVDTEPGGGSPEEFGTFLIDEQKKWGDAVRQAGVTLE